MTVSLPPEMVADIEKVRRTERRTRSELVREALRVYFDRIRTLPVYTPTRQELREIEKGRAEMRRGNYYTLDEFSRWLLGRPHKKSRAKTVAARPEA